jgi:Flp pilus assembly protein TadD
MQVAYIRNILAAVLITTSCLLALKPVCAANSASEYRALGLSYRASQRYTEAIAALKKSTLLEPKNLSGWVMLGWTQHLAGQEDAAIESLFQVLYHDPASVPALNALGIVYLVSGKLNAAVAVHAWAAFLESKNEVANFNLSLAFHRLQIYESAIATAKKAATLEPNNPHPLVALALAHWGMGDRTQALLAYRRATNLDFRYRDRSFLQHLKKAGFSSDQIRIAEQILSTTNN